MKAKENIDSVGKELRALRQNTSLGIKTVANRVGMNYTYLSKIENGYKVPSREIILKLCALYGENPDRMVSKLGMLPADIQEIISQNGKEVFNILRSLFKDKGDGHAD